MQPAYLAAIEAYRPANEQETADQRLILDYAKRDPVTVLTRQSEIAHITSSGFIMNPSLSKVLMVHHNIRDCWAWTGGHADGDGALLSVALREAMEETGASQVVPLSESIASIDVLPVFRHTRRGRYVSAHLHLSVAYLLCCDEGESLRVKPDENTGVKWIETARIVEPHFSPSDVYLYQKLIFKARCV